MIEDDRVIVGGAPNKRSRLLMGKGRVPVEEPLYYYDDTVVAAAMSNDGQQTVSVSYNSTARLWSTFRRNETAQSLHGSSNHVPLVAVSRKNHRIVSGWLNSIACI